MTAQYKCYNSSQLWQWDTGNITSQYYLKLRGKHYRRPIAVMGVVDGAVASNLRAWATKTPDKTESKLSR